MEEGHNRCSLSQAADRRAYLKTWLRTATPTTGTPASWNSYQWGELKVSRWDVMQEFLIRGGVIKEKLLIDQIWFGALLFDEDAARE